MLGPSGDGPLHGRDSSSFLFIKYSKVTYLAASVLSCIMPDCSLQRTDSLAVAGGLQSTQAQSGSCGMWA